VKAIGGRLKPDISGQLGLTLLPKQHYGDLPSTKWPIAQRFDSLAEVWHQARSLGGAGG